MINSIATWMIEFLLPFTAKTDKGLSEFERNVRTEVRAFDSRSDVSGEYKRHQIYAKMIKAYPLVPKNVIGLEIELAVAELRD